MKVNLPCDYPAYIYVIIKYGEPRISCARGDVNQKFIFNSALFNNKPFYKPSQSERIRNRQFIIELIIPNSVYKVSYFKGIGEMAMNDINEMLNEKFYTTFVDYMNKRCLPSMGKRNPGYDVAIWDFIKKYGIDETFMSYESLYKYYYRYRNEDPILSKMINKMQRKQSCQMSIEKAL